MISSAAACRGPKAVQFWFKGHGNDTDFSLYKSIWQRSLTRLLKPLGFWLRLRGDIGNQKSPPCCYQLCVSLIRESLAELFSGNSLCQRFGDLSTPCLFLIRRVADSHINETGSRQLSVSTILGVDNLLLSFGSWIRNPVFFLPLHLDPGSRMGKKYKHPGSATLFGMANATVIHAVGLAS